ncbi:MAG: hypothetical protein ACFCUJ_07355 [Thiotrichales bacterium]
MDMTCPVCGLACDDLKVLREGDALRLAPEVCTLAADFLRRASADTPPEPRLRDQPVTLETALDRAGELLTAASAPLVAGLAVDVAGMRAAVQLAERCGAALDHLHGDALARNLRLMQDSGGFTTTFSEVRNHADCIVLVGSAQVLYRFPRFVERVLAPPGEFVSGRRQLFHVGPVEAVTEPTAPFERTTIPVALADSADLANWLNATIAGHAVDHPPLWLASETGATLLHALETAHYTVILWDAAEFDFPHAELVLEAWSRLARDLNRQRRAAAMPLGGGLGGVTAQQVCTWQTGVPLRSVFASGAPVHDPWRHDGSRMLAADEADLLLWLNPLEPAPPPLTRAPVIVLGHPATPATPEVFIPVGIPAVDHAGHCFRADGVVTLPLRALRAPRQPPLAAVVAQLLRRLPPC